MPTRVEQLLADPDFRSLPSAQREPLLVDAIAADTPATSTGTVRLGPSREDLPATGAEPTFEQETTPTPESQALTAPILPGTARSFKEVFLGKPGDIASSEERRKSASASIAGTKRDILPTTGMIAGTAIGGALGGPPGAAVGDMLGTTAGYGANVALGIEPLDLPTAANRLLPSYLLNTWPALKGPLAALARSSQVGKEAALEAKQAPVIAANIAEQGRFDAASQASDVRMAGQKTALMADQGTIQAANTAEQGRFDAATQASDVRMAGQKTALMADRQAAETTNRVLQADFDNTMAVKAHSQAVQDARHATDVESWNAVMEQRAATQEAYTNAVTNFKNTLTEQRAASNRLPIIQKKANVSEAASFAENAIPTPPTKKQIDEAYKAIDDLAATNLKADGTPITYKIPELQAVQGNMGTTADMLEKFPGTERFVGWLRARAKNPEALTLTDIQTYTSFLNDEMSNLRGPTTRNFAAQESRHVGKTLEALDTGLENLAKSAGIPDQFRMLLLNARAMYLQRQTSEELTQFVTHDVLTRSTGGEQILNPVRALQALDSERYRSMRFFMQKIDAGEGKTLYDTTKTLFEDMAKQGMSRKDMLNLHALQTGESLGSEYQALPAGHPALQAPPAPPKPMPAAFSPTGLKPRPNLAPVPEAQAVPPSGLSPQPVLTPVPEAQPVPPSGFTPQPNLTPVPQGDTKAGAGAVIASYGTHTSGLIGGAAAIGTGMINPYVAGPLGLIVAGVPNFVAALLRTPGGQKTLMTLIANNGTRIDVGFEGFLRAATVGLLPQDSAPPTPASP